MHFHTIKQFLKHKIQKEALSVRIHDIGLQKARKKNEKPTAMASILAKTKVYQSNGWSCQKGRNGR